jgi:hypothetical protein
VDFDEDRPSGFLRGVKGGGRISNRFRGEGGRGDEQSGPKDTSGDEIAARDHGGVPIRY